VTRPTFGHKTLTQVNSSLRGGGGIWWVDFVSGDGVDGVCVQLLRSGSKLLYLLTQSKKFLLASVLRFKSAQVIRNCTFIRIFMP